MFCKERCLSGEEKRNSSLKMQPLKVVVLCLSAKRDIGAAPAEPFYAILVFRHKRSLSFWRNSRQWFSLWSLHCQPTNGAVNVTFVNRKQDIKPKLLSALVSTWLASQQSGCKRVCSSGSAPPLGSIALVCFPFPSGRSANKSCCPNSPSFPFCSLWLFLDLCVCCVYSLSCCLSPAAHSGQ